MTPRRIGFIGYDGLTALDLVGPMEAFASAFLEGESGGPRPCYETVVLGLTERPFRAASGLVIKPDASLARAPRLDTLIVPGGAGLREGQRAANVAGWISSEGSRIRRIASVCTGIYGLAATGLLDGRHVTTHWHHAADVARRFPRLLVEPNAIFQKDGRFYTSAGVTAGIDLALALIEEDHGPGVALSVARELVVYMKRPGGQEQYSEPLKFQVKASDRFADLASWVPAHLRHDLSVEVLAARVGLCPRHFSRRFKESVGVSPAAFVEELRLDEARRRLSVSGFTVEGVAASVGFQSADSFRRAFERRFGIAPSSYRGRFARVSGEGKGEKAS